MKLKIKLKMKRKVKIRNSALIPSKYGPMTFYTFKFLKDRKEHFAICFGNWKGQEIVNLRIHSECLTGEVLCSSKCDCGEQLDEAMRVFSQDHGVIIYLRQEGRGIGLYNKIDAYALQELGFDTFEANHFLDFEDDHRDYKVAADILSALEISNVNLLTNNPKKIKGIEDNGIRVKSRIPTNVFLKPENKEYLKTKVSKSLHLIRLGEHDD